jgi:hypothetical protein
MAAGGAVLASAAGAAPAFAATQAGSAPSPSSHMITVTAQRSAGISPRATLPCAVPGPAASAQVRPATCGLPSTIECTIDASVPVITSSHTISAGATVHCTSPISAIRLDETLVKGSPGTQIDASTDDPVGEANAFGVVGGGACQPVNYDNFAFAGLDFPAGYSPSTASIHDLSTLTPTARACGTTSGGGGGGGGGGCSITAPPVPAQSAADLPRVIACP